MTETPESFTCYQQILGRSNRTSHRGEKKGGFITGVKYLTQAALEAELKNREFNCSDPVHERRLH